MERLACSLYHLIDSYASMVKHIMKSGADASLNPLRKCVQQCKQRKFTPAPQTSVYVGATSRGCGAASIFFLSMCVTLTESLCFPHDN